MNKDRNWKDLNGVAVLHSTRENVHNSEKSEAFRYFIYSHKDMTADRFLTLQRKHWAIENNLHWSLDCCFHEDDMHVRLGHAAVVLNAFRKLCMQMLKADKSVKGSLSEKSSVVLGSLSLLVQLLTIGSLSPFLIQFRKRLPWFEHMPCLTRATNVSMI